MSKKLIALIFYFFLHTAFAESVPPLINYQGMLTDSEGKPLANGTKKLTFNIYASASSTTSIWGPQVFTIVPLINGQFNVILGTTDTTGRSLVTAFSKSNRYLGIKVGNEAEITPRQQILSTPYAMQAENSVNAVQAENSANAVNADMLGGGVVNVKNGNVGIGTSNPQEKLEVNGDLKVAGTLSADLKQNSCEWVNAHCMNGHGCPGGEIYTGICPSGKYMAGFRLTTWLEYATYHHQIYCCSSR